jgi:hypothetical protein
MGSSLTRSVKPAVQAVEDLSNIKELKTLVIIG